MRLEDKVAIITGGANGMGAEEARMFAREGAKVVVADMRDEDGEAVVTQIAESGGTGVYVHTDVTSESDWQRLVDQTVSQFGKLNILVNNAGISSTAYSDPMDIDGWTHIMDVNATGVFLGTRAAIPAMKEAGGGSIVNISSSLALVGSSGSSAYAASKGAVRIFTKSAAVQYAKDGIRVNSVHPGLVESPMTEEFLSDAATHQGRLNMYPLGRLGQPEDIAWGVLFLASDESSFVTGSELVIDGGLTAQ